MQIARRVSAFGISRWLAVLAAIVVATALYSTGASAATATLPLDNGSFEDPTGGGTLTSWTTSNLDRLPTSGGWQAVDGSWLIDLNGSDSGSVQQVITTQIGAGYSVSFSMAGNPQCGNPATKDLTTTSPSTGTNTFSFTTASGATIGNLGWVTESFNFTASATSTTLAWTSNSTGACGALLDNIVVTRTSTPAPVPGVTFWGMTLLGAALFSLLLHRRMRKGPALA